MHLTAEQREFRDAVRAFARDEVKPVAMSSRRLEPFAKPLLVEQLNAASHMGLRALLLAEESGGAGAVFKIPVPSPDHWRRCEWRR